MNRTEKLNSILTHISFAQAYTSSPSANGHLLLAHRRVGELLREEATKEEAGLDALARFVMEEKQEPKDTKKARLLASLQSRPYPVTMKTLQNECGGTELSMSKHIEALRKEGYNIVCKRGGKPKYKLLKRA